MTDPREQELFAEQDEEPQFTRCEDCMSRVQVGRECVPCGAENWSRE